MNWNDLLEESALATLLPQEYEHFAKPICEGLAVFLQGLPEAEQAEIIAVQMALDSSATQAERLGLLARSCPVLQKIGQILAREQRLARRITRAFATARIAPSNGVVGYDRASSCQGVGFARKSEHHTTATGHCRG